MDQLKNAHEYTFRMGPLVNLPSLVRSLGCDPSPVFRESGFDPEDFNDPDLRMPYLRGSQLLANCVEATGCEQLGFLLGQMAAPSHLGMPGFLLHTAPTVKQALQSLVKNLDLHDEGITASLDTGPEYSSLGFAVIISGVLAVEQIHDLSTTIMYRVMRSLCGANWTASTVHLERRKPNDLTPYRTFFDTTLYFNSPQCVVTFQNKYLRQKPPAADVLLHSFLQREAMFLHHLQHQDLMASLPAIMTRGLLTGEFSACQIANEFGVHERTLHRRLRAAGTSFRKELDLARRSESEQLLEATSLPICDIASCLGYTTSSSFIRAFRRWYGTCPSSWRNRNTHTS